MKSFTKVVIILVMISVAGFTIVTKEETNIRTPEYSSVTNPDLSENNSVNTSLINYIDKGEMTASWYGPRFHGKLTANGEYFDQGAFTAAHKKLKFGTLLKITNLRNSKSVIVRINDRGPYIKGRQLDLSKAAATQLGMLHRGVIKVDVEQISLKGVNFPVITLN